MAWNVFRQCRGQIRYTAVSLAVAGGSRSALIATGLDFQAVIAFADRMGANSDLFIEMLPEVEAIIVRNSRAGDDA